MDLGFQNEKRLLSVLKHQINKQMALNKNVALDADGTLWLEDVNNIFLRYEIKHGLRDVKDLLDPYYEQDNHRHLRCRIFAERQAGLTLQEFKSHCLKALLEHPLHLFSFQKKLIKYLKQKEMKLFVVTASIKWLVETALDLYNIPVDKVLGVEPKLSGDVISSELLEPVPVAQSKGEVFLKCSQGQPCFLAGGNSSSDLPLLKMAKIAFVVHSAPPGHENFPSEDNLKKVALKNHWILFQNFESLAIEKGL